MLFSAARRTERGKMMKLRIQNASIVDGTGAPAFSGDVLVEGGRLASVGGCAQGDFDRVIDAQGLTVCPGFIDTHSHSDLAILDDPRVLPKIMQGITTEIFGQDGISMAPLPEAYIDDWRENIAGLDGTSNTINWRYYTTAGYFEELAKRGTGTNAAYLAPHGNIRMEAMGLEDRPAAPQEMEKMKAILRRELEAGAIGLSTGLIYTPCAYAGTEELIELCKVVAEYGGSLVVHQRSESGHILDSMREIIRVGRESGVHIHFSHFKICGKENWKYMEPALHLLDEAEAEGIQVSLDQYPYTAGSTMLGVILPPWAHDGGTEKLLERLTDKNCRERLKADMLANGCDWDNFVEFAGLKGIYITDVADEQHRTAVGRNLVQLGELYGEDPLDATFDLLEEEHNAVGMIDYYGCEENVISVLQRPEQNVCTDGLLGGRPHPRVYGAFPRILARYVREKKCLTLEEAVHKMTGKPAQTFGFTDRGTLQPGKAADLVLFDPATIRDTATFANPIQFPEGIRMVLVNGQIVVDQNQHTGAIAGQLLKAKR